MSETQAMITVKNLVTHYGERQILHGIDMNVEPREIMVIMGGSGSGKSTLLRHIMGLERATSGSIEVLGESIEDLDSYAMDQLRKKTGAAFQSGALFSSMSVGENIMLPLLEHTELDRSTMEIMVRMKLEIVNLSGFEDLMPSELSGGMIKRVALARAIIMDPRLLFCDEPSAGLDPISSAALDNLLLKLRDSFGMTIVVVTHELESIFKIADRVTVLDQGNILFTGTVDELHQSENVRIQNLLNRQSEENNMTPEEYLRRLTGEPPLEEETVLL